MSRQKPSDVLQKSHRRKASELFWSDQFYGCRCIVQNCCSGATVTNQNEADTLMGVAIGWRITLECKPLPRRRKRSSTVQKMML